MNVDYVRQIAAECDELLDRLTHPPVTAGLELDLETFRVLKPVSPKEVLATLARAAAVLHTAVLPPDSHGEPPNGTRAPSDNDKPAASQQEPTGDRCQYCGADCSNGRSWDGGDLYTCTRCAIDRADMNALRKRWHEAATQRDTLARAARDFIDEWAEPPRTDRLLATLEAVEATGKFPVPADDRLRRELWHVLDRMPASDDNLIATVKKLKEDLDEASKSYHESVRQHEKTADVMEKAQNERDELREATRKLVKSRWDIPAAYTRDAPVASSVVRPELLDRLAELAKDT